MLNYSRHFEVFDQEVVSPPPLLDLVHDDQQQLVFIEHDFSKVFDQPYTFRDFRLRSQLGAGVPLNVIKTVPQSRMGAADIASAYQSSVVLPQPTNND